MITATRLEAVQNMLSREGVDERAISGLRRAYPEMHFTYCMDDDIQDEVTPIIESDDFNLYLVDGRDHCLLMTTQADIATGLVIAEKYTG